MSANGASPSTSSLIPTGDYLRPTLQGHRLVGGRYVPVAVKDGTMHSAVLGLDLVAEGDTLRLYDPLGDRFLPTLIESEATATSAQARAERLAARLRELGET